MKTLIIIKEKLKKSLYIKLIENGNLYLATNPLVDSKPNECEIKDLFDKETLEHEINGKTFSRKNNSDNTTYYGKARFAEYILANFKKILDNISEIAENYK